MSDNTVGTITECLLEDVVVQLLVLLKRGRVSRPGFRGGGVVYCLVVAGILLFSFSSYLTV